MNYYIALLNLNSLFTTTGLIRLLMMALVLVISLSFHEVAHGYIALRLGDDTARLANRLTMNPVSHIDPMGALCFLFVGIGWARPVPVNPMRFNRKFSQKFGMVLVSVAGPLANLILAFISVLLFFVLITVAMIWPMFNSNTFILVRTFLTLMYTYNIVLAVFNLLPIPPLDGWKIASAFLPQRIYFQIMRYEHFIGLAMMLLILLGSGAVIGTLVNLLRQPFDAVIYNPLRYLFELLWQKLG